MKTHTAPDWTLHHTETHLELRAVHHPEWKPIFVDFLAGEILHRCQFGGGRRQSIARACGLSKTSDLKILDVTAGLGSDAFVLAHLGADVTLIERSPFIHALLQDGLKRAEKHPAAKRLHLKPAQDAKTFLTALTEKKFDVIYLDPMFPEKKNSALSKKEMRALHEIVGEDLDAETLLTLAVQHAKKRVVVKRPRLAKPLGNHAPNESLVGKSGRFDLYFVR